MLELESSGSSEKPFLLKIALLHTLFKFLGRTFTEKTTLLNEYDSFVFAVVCWKATIVEKVYHFSEKRYLEKFLTSTTLLCNKYCTVSGFGIPISISAKYALNNWISVFTFIAFNNILYYWYIVLHKFRRKVF